MITNKAIKVFFLLIILPFNAYSIEPNTDINTPISLSQAGEHFLLNIVFCNNTKEDFLLNEATFENPSFLVFDIKKNDELPIPSKLPSIHYSSFPVKSVIYEFFWFKVGDKRVSTFFINDKYDLEENKIYRLEYYNYGLIDLDANGVDFQSDSIYFEIKNNKLNILDESSIDSNQ